MATDELGAGTVVLLLAIIIIYLIIFRSQYAQLANGTIRLQVLVTRIALIFPLYAFLMYIALLAPAAYVALQLPLVIIEGYSLYCFFVLMVTNYGGPANTVEMIKRHGDKKCCGGCFPKDPLKFYLRIHSVLYQVMTTRIVITFLEIIFYYLMQRKENLKPLYAICLAIQSLMVLYCVVTFLVFVENQFVHSQNLNRTIVKVALLKLSVGMIVVQGAAVQFIYEFGGFSDIDDDSQFSAAEKAQRGYAFVVLLELMVLAAIGIVGYGGKISPPPKGVIVSRTDDVSDPEGKLNMPVCTFLSMVFSFTDIFGVLPYKEGTMEEPLSGNNL